MPQFARILEVTANIGIVVVSCLLTLAIVRSYFLDKQPAQIASSASASTENLGLRSLDVDWATNKRTLILALSTTCHFCTESAPFYRSLTKQSGAGTRIIAVFPQPVEAGETYLSGLGVPVDEVRSIRLDKILVGATPTLLLVDDTGQVREFWVGKLALDQESRVLNTLQTQ